MELCRFIPPRPRAKECLPLSDAPTTEVHVRVICTQLAATLNAVAAARRCAPDAEALYRQSGALPRPVRAEIAFAAGGLCAHEYYFRYLLPHRKGGLPPAVHAALCRSFGAADSFFYIFREEAQRMRAGGFLWLCAERPGGRLHLIPCAGYELPDAAYTPLLALDLWEHAYLPRWGGDRRGYADAFLAQLAWEEIARSVSFSACS